MFGRPMENLQDSRAWLMTAAVEVTLFSAHFLGQSPPVWLHSRHRKDILLCDVTNASNITECMLPPATVAEILGHVYSTTSGLELTPLVRKELIFRNWVPYHL